MICGQASHRPWLPFVRFLDSPPFRVLDLLPYPPICRSSSFFYRTLLHDLRDLLPGWSLGRSLLRRHHLFLVPLFATIQHPAHSICQDAVLIWDTSTLLGTQKMKDRQQSFFWAHFRAFCAIRQRPFFVLRFCIWAAVLFCAIFSKVSLFFR